MGRRVMVVDDEPDIRELLRLQLGQHGYEVDEAASGRDAIDHHLREPADAMILDQRMPGMTGLAVARRLTGLGHGCAMALYSAFLDPAVNREARERGIPTFAKGDLPSIVAWLDEVCGAA